MNFGDIVTAVCKDGIDPQRRADAKIWVAFRHAWVWDAKPWTFKFKTAAITFTNGAQAVAAADAPTDIHAVLAVYNAHGDPLRGVRDLRRFFDVHNTLADTGSGTPEAYTVVNGQLFVGPKGDGSAGLIVYEKSKPSLVNDGDVTGLPDGYDLALVHGGKAEGFKLTNIPLADQFDADFTAAINALENNWLDSVREQGGQMGAFRPGVMAAWRP